ncbi:MAG: hypothetical protein N2C12_01720, partial [Planctomycetales bacterium]
MPIWQADSPAMPQSDVERTVTDAATQLVVSLDIARGFTTAWTNEPLAFAFVASNFSTCLNRLASTGVWGHDNQLPGSLLWKIAGDLLETGWLQRRAREKPLGYAGDYQLLSAIVHQNCCSHPLGRAFDRYFLAQAAPQAVRNRTQIVAQTLATSYYACQRKPFRIVSIGSGPALDIRHGIELLPQD